MRLQKNKLILLIIIGVFTALHIPLLKNPYHYDAVAWVSQSKYLLENGMFSIPTQDFGHPYLMFWILAFFYKVLGESVIISHSVILFFSLIAIIMTYLIGKDLFTENIGLLAALFLASQPWFFIVSSWVYFDIPLTAFFLITMYCFIRFSKTENKKYLWLFALFGSLTTLIKAPGILVSIIPVTYLLFKRKLKKEHLIFIIPLLVFASWSIWHLTKVGYIYHPTVESGVLIPSSLENIFAVGKNFTTNIFFNFIQNGNFIAFLVITYLLFWKKHPKFFIGLTILFLLFGDYSFLLTEPDLKFYPFLILMNGLFIFWLSKMFKLQDEYKFLLIWISTIMLHSFYAQISFRYGLPMLPAFAILFSSAIQKIKSRNLILILVFSLLILQTFNYTNYYSSRDKIYQKVFDFFENKTPQSVMASYPLATPDLLAVKHIDSRPWGNIRLYLVPSSRQDFNTINPQYLVIDKRTVDFNRDYIQDIIRTKNPEISISNQIKWYTYFGSKSVFINKLHIYKFH